MLKDNITLYSLSLPLAEQENLEKMKDEIKRVQFAVEGEFEASEFKEFNIIKSVKIGSINLCTLTGDADEFRKRLEKEYKVFLFDKLSMSLEEIFITELGGAGYGTEKK